MVDLRLRDPDPGLVNDDIRPVPASQRHWTILSMASLWVGMVVCVPTYMLAGGLIDQGMSWSQAVLTILLELGCRATLGRFDLGGLDLEEVAAKPPTVVIVEAVIAEATSRTARRIEESF